MLSDKAGKRLDTLDDSYVVFDLETTGISAETDRIIEIAAVKVLENHITDEFSALVDPKCHIHESASAVNGIFDHMVSGQPVIEEILPAFIDFIDELPLAGHNIQSFDLNFIYRDSMEYLGGIPNNDYIDTLILARKYLPELGHHAMTDLAAFYGISTKGAHRALADCHMTQKVYEKLLDEMELVESGKKVIPLCRQCGRQMKLRSGKFGQFWGCAGYPECRFTQKYLPKIPVHTP